MISRGLTIVLLYTMIAMFSPTFAQVKTVQSLDAIEQLAYEYVLTLIQNSAYPMAQINISPLDKRLRLAGCEQPMQPFLRGKGFKLGTQMVGVKCESSSPWTVYVSVKVMAMRDVVITRQALPAKHILTEQDVVMTSMDIGQLRQVPVRQISDIIGRQLKRSVAMGAVLSHSQLKKQKLVRRGQQVTLFAKAGSIQVKMAGIALADAVLGEKIKVKNSRSQRVIEGIVAGPNRIRIE
ncbi:MAG TPA: flagella basal body P-ring formation protein FlgA [Gammaproteobacteria bacterium]|nr:flagella basal body P-ring formation protein FlgA [Gammaproteobacteria bacterium]